MYNNKVIYGNYQCLLNIHEQNVLKYLSA